MVGLRMHPGCVVRTSSGRIVMPTVFDFRHAHARGPTAFSGGLYRGKFVSNAAHYTDTAVAGVYVMYSDDDGVTWQRNRDGEMFAHLTPAVYTHLTEPTLAEAAPGNLLMFFRTQLGRTYQSRSLDNGETWSRPEPTTLAAAPSPGALLRVPDSGHLIFIWNQAGEEDIRRGLVRCRISSAVSRNQGVLWENFQNIESCIDEPRARPTNEIRLNRPAEWYSRDGSVLPQFDSRYVTPMPDNYTACTNLRATLHRDRVLVNYAYSVYDEQARRNAHLPPGTPASGWGRLKVLPLNWFYGGLDRAKDEFTGVPSVFAKATAEP
jgi:hypothetical protein